MTNNRRNFIKTTAMASVAFALNSFKGKPEEESAFLSKKGKKPIKTLCSLCLCGKIIKPQKFSSNFL